MNLVDSQREDPETLDLGSLCDICPLHDPKWTSEVDQTETVSHERRADRPQADHQRKHEESPSQTRTSLSDNPQTR